MACYEADFSRFVQEECSTCVVDSESLAAFLKVNEEKDRLISVVTSGGTRAALEKRMVRCLENFSTGLRGARITESFLDDQRYAVVLLMRRGAIVPYARHYSTRQFRDSSLFQPCIGGVQLTNEVANVACRRLHESIDDKRLMVIEYDSVQEYLLALNIIATSSARLEQRVMFCLAAAVSDYYIPQKELFNHKLASDSDVITLKLCKVPKCLGLLSTKWAPKAFITSFKLETDPSLLQAKAERALNIYRTDMVVANTLDERYREVVLVEKGNIETINIKCAEKEPIEIRLAQSLASRHRARTNSSN